MHFCTFPFCGTTRSRTRDTRIFSPLLYQLSYGTAWERKRRDSNSWYGYPYGSLANCWFQPLTHTSSKLYKLLLFCSAKVITIFEITKCFENFFEVSLICFLRNRILLFMIMSDEILMVSL